MMRKLRARAGRRRGASRLFERLEGRRLLTAGDLDLTFGTGGMAAADLPGTNNPEIGYDVAVDPATGKILVAGNAAGPFSGQDFTVARFHPDGRLDTSFGQSGWAFAGMTGLAEPRGIAVQADGKIVVVGGVSPGPRDAWDFGVARFNADGSLDTSFGSGGKRITDFHGKRDLANAVAIQPDGKIVVVGEGNDGLAISSQDFAVARYNPDGSPDPSFRGGKVLTEIATGTNESENVAKDVVIQPDGRIVVAGQADRAGFTVVRYAPDGTLDGGFADGGIRRGELRTNGDFAHSVALMPDGRIVVGGYAGVPDANGMALGFDFALARFLPDGAWDTSFGGGDGFVFTDFGIQSDDVLRGIVVQPDGKVIAGGNSTAGPHASVGWGPALARYSLDGSLDPTFGTGGMALPDSGAFRGSISAIALQADGKVVAAGTCEPTFLGLDFFVTRYENDLPPPNRPPVVDAGPDLAGVESQRFVIEASVSDADGDVPTVTWSLSRNGFLQGVGFAGAIEFAALDDARYEVTVTADDGRGGVASDTVVIDVANVAPAFEVPDVVLAPERGGRLLMTIPFTDPGLELDWRATLFSGAPIGGEGIRNAPVDAVNKTVSVDFTYPAPGVYPARLEMWDDDAHVTREFQVTVLSNTPPVAEANGPYVLNEGTARGISAAGSGDAEQEATTLDYAWDLDGDGDYDDAAGMFQVLDAMRADGPALRTIGLRVTDDGGLWSTDTAVVEIRNTPPQATLAAGGAVREGSAGAVQFTDQRDPSPADTAAGFTYSYDFDNDGTFDLGDGTYAGGVRAAGATVPAAYLADDGTRTVRARIVDKDGGRADYTTNIVVSNVAPEAVITMAPAQNPEGATVTLGSAVNDPGADTFAYAWSVTKDGAAYAAGAEAGFSFTADDQGTYVVTLTVTDDDGGVGSDTRTIDFTNVAPTAALVNDGPVQEGSRVGFRLLGAADPSPADTAAEFDSAWDFEGDGVFVRIPSGLTASYPFAEDGTYVVPGRVYDKDGGFSEYETTVTVTNAPPVVGALTVVPGEAALPGTVVTATALLADAGLYDTHLATWDWGDGSVEGPAAVGAGAVSASHAYAAPGVYVVTLTVVDDDGGVGRSEALSVTVLSAEQAVAGVAEELLRIVEDGGGLGENQAAGLVSKLDRAAAAAAGGGDEKAVQMLEAFKHQVLGFVAGGKLTEAAGGLLVDEADEIIEWIRGS